MTRLDFEFRYSDFSQLQHYMGRRLVQSNRGRYGTAFGGVVLCAVLIAFAIVVNLYASPNFRLFGAPYPRSILILLIVILSGAVLALIPAVMLRLSTLRSQISDRGPLLGPTSLTLAEDGMTVSRALITTHYKWGAFRSVEIARGAVILPIDEGMGIIIPRIAFKSDTERFEFMAEISRKIEAAKGAM